MRRLRLRKRLRCRRNGHSYYAVWGTDSDSLLAPLGGSDEHARLERIGRRGRGFCRSVPAPPGEWRSRASALLSSR